LAFPEFISRLKRQIRCAWKDGDQAGPETQLILSYLGSYGITDGVPTLVAPACGIMFIGACYQSPDGLQATVSLTFDHRLINGVAAARFLGCIDREIDRLHKQAGPLINQQSQEI
jgi:hypothetical protein